jgi:hypothetical protein
MTAKVDPEAERIVAETLENPVIPENRRQTKAAGLGDKEMHLYGAILAAFPKLGGPPAGAWVQLATARLGLDPEAVLRELVRRDLITRDSETGAIETAYPYSGSPTAQRVQIEGGLPVYAMCAVDALGIPFMVRRDTTITSSDPTTGDAVHIEVRGREAHADPPNVVVFLGSTGGSGPAAEEACPLINFFRSEESARRFLNDHPDARGSILTLEEALEVGRQVFGVSASP